MRVRSLAEYFRRRAFLASEVGRMEEYGRTLHRMMKDARADEKKGRLTREQLSKTLNDLGERFQLNQNAISRKKEQIRRLRKP